MIAEGKMDSKKVNIKLGKDIEYTLQFSKWLLKPLGLWWMLSDTQNKNYKYWSFFSILFNTLLILFLIVPGGIYMIVEEKNLIKRIVLFGPICFGFTSCVKYFIMIVRIRTIHDCLQYIIYDWKIASSEIDRLKMFENVRIGRKFMAFCAIFMYTGGLSYHTVLPFFLHKSEAIKNKTNRPHVYYGYDAIFDTQATPNYETLFTVHVIGSVVTYTIAMAVCSLATLSACHICGQVDIINSLIHNLVSKNNGFINGRIENQIAFIIKRHTKILRFATLIEKMLCEVCLAEILANTLLICLLEYYFIKEWENSEVCVIVTYVVLIISLSCNSFIFCYIGEILQERCLSIGSSVYMTNWYELPTKSRLWLLLTIAMANCPLKITAGRLIDLNVRNFGSVVKTSLVYLNMLRTVAE